MATVQEKATFIGKLKGVSIEFEKNSQRNDLRANALENIMGSGLDNDRNVLRKLMDVSIKEKGDKGKVLKSNERDPLSVIEVEDSHKYESISKDEKMNSQTAMEVILQLQKELLAQKDSEGKPLFTEEEAAAEIWTPLMREGIMPETFIPDKYSETAKMLEATFKLYKKNLKKKRQDENEASAKMEVKAVTTKMGAIKKKYTEIQENVANTLNSYLPDDMQSTTKQERLRMLKIAKKGLKVARVGKKTVSMIEGLPSDLSEAMDQLGQQTAGYEYMKGNTGPVEEIAEEQELANAESRNPKEIVFMGNVTDSIDLLLGSQATPEMLRAFNDAFDEELNNLAGPIREQMATDDAVFAQNMTKLALKAIYKITVASIKLDMTIDKYKELEEQLKRSVESAAKRTEIDAVAVALVGDIDDAICATLARVNPQIACILSGRFADEIDEDKFTDQAMIQESKESPRDPQKIIDAIAEAVEDVLKDAVKQSVPSSAFKKAGEAFTSMLEKELAVSALKDSLRETEPTKLFTPVLPAVKAAAKAFLNPEFIKVVQSEECQQDLQKTGKSANEKMEQDYDRVQEELQDFERELMLIDEGGMELAKQQSIEKLILELKRDRQVLMIVEASANLLRTLGRTIPGMGVAINNKVVEDNVTDTIKEVGMQTFAEEVGGQVTAALNAARLITQLTVNAIRAAERWMIWNRLKEDIEKAFKARSFLLPAIENFVSNKEEQIAYHRIEDVMLGIQLAGSIASTIPEPISLVIGKTLSLSGKLGQAANKLSKAAFDEVTIRKAWERTLTAIDNPANRKAGMQAIRDNILLAAHSVAWAAMQGDPIAQQILRSCNVQAQSLADDQTDAKIVVKYLMTYLADTGKGEVNMEKALSDPEKVKLNWKPEKLELTMASWFTTRHRARTLANPPLHNSETKNIDTAIKLVEAAPSIASITENLVSTDKAALELMVTNLNALIKAFTDYKPVTPDGTKHSMMGKVVDEFKELADDRLYEVQKLFEKRQTM